MCDDKETIQHTKGQRRHGEEVHCGDGLRMIAQKCRPSFCRFRTSRRFPHPAQDRSLRNAEAEHLQLAMNARRTPCRILGNHAEDEFAQFFGNAFSSCAFPMPRKPRPIQLEPSSVPANHSLRLYENQHTLPSRPEPPQCHPEQLVRTCIPRLRTPRFQNSKLMPQSQVFQQKVATRTYRPNQQNEQESHQAQHTISLTRRHVKKISTISANHNFSHVRGGTSEKATPQ